MNTELIIKKDEAIQKIENEIDEILLDAPNIEITDAESLSRAGDLLVLSKKLSKKIDDKRAETVKPYNDVIKEYNNSIKEIVAKADQISVLVAPKYKVYTDEQARLERERLRKEQEAEAAQARLEAEEAEAHILKVADENNCPELIEQAIEQSEIARHKVTQIVEKKVEVKVINRSNTGSISERDNWTASVVSKIDVLRYIIRAYEADIDLTHMVDFPQAKLNEYARGKKTIETKNGIKVVNNKTMVTR